MRWTLSFLCIVVLLSMASTIHAQFTTVINVPPDISPSSIGTDTQLNLFDGGAIPQSFDAGDPAGASTNVEVNITGGSVNAFFNAYSGSTVNITGGVVGFFFDAHSGSEVNVSGGSVGAGFDAKGGSQVNISGGLLGDQFEAYSGSSVDISGGSFGGRFNALEASQVNIAGTEFYLDGLPVAGLMPGVPQTISDRDVTLSGTLADMSPFSFELNSTPVFGEDFFNASATLTLTLLTPTNTGDYNADGVVDAADYVVWRKNDGTPDRYNTWRANFGTVLSGLGSGSTLNLANASSAVPEPASLVLLFCAAIYPASRRLARHQSMKLAETTGGCRPAYVST